MIAQSNIFNSPDDKPFEEILQENLDLYCSFNPESGQNIFNLNREIAIARFALSKQAETYTLAIELLTDLLRKVQEKNTNISQDVNTLTSIMVAINNIESKSQSLIDSVQRITNLIGTVINLDVDKSKLRSLLINLPSLVKETIDSFDPHLADQVKDKLDSKINSMMIAIRFDDVNQPLQHAPQGILLDQYSQMVNSVPTQPNSGLMQD